MKLFYEIYSAIKVAFISHIQWNVIIPLSFPLLIPVNASNRLTFFYVKKIKWKCILENNIEFLGSTIEFNKLRKKGHKLETSLSCVIRVNLQKKCEAI